MDLLEKLSENFIKFFCVIPDLQRIDWKFLKIESVIVFCMSAASTTEEKHTNCH